MSLKSLLERLVKLLLKHDCILYISTQEALVCWLARVNADGPEVFEWLLCFVSSAGQILFSLSFTGQSLSVLLFLFSSTPHYECPGTPGAHFEGQFAPHAPREDWHCPRLVIFSSIVSAAYIIELHYIAYTACIDGVQETHGYAAFSLHTLYLLLCVIEKLVREADKITDKT